MYKTRPAFFFQLGFDVPSVIWLRAETSLEQRGDLLARSVSALEIFTSAEYVGEMLPRSNAAAKELLEELRAWKRSERMIEQLPTLRQHIQVFVTMLTEEMDRTHVYTMTDKGNLSVDRLVDGASKGYNPAILSLIDIRTVNEIDDAGKCLACALYTACGFHILRSVEMAVKAYVFAAKGTLPVEKQRSWGTYIQWLAGTASTNVIDALTILKGKRNPLMHPQHTLTEPQAISIFCLCEATLESIADDIKNKPLEAKFIAAFEEVRKLEAVP